MACRYEQYLVNNNLMCFDIPPLASPNINCKIRKQTENSRSDPYLQKCLTASLGFELREREVEIHEPPEYLNWRSHKPNLLWLLL